MTTINARHDEDHVYRQALLTFFNFETGTPHEGSHPLRFLSRFERGAQLLDIMETIGITHLGSMQR